MPCWLLGVILCTLAAFGQALHWENPWSNTETNGLEPRSFASLAGLPSSSKVFLYGGFSHVRSEWLDDLWSLDWNQSVPAMSQLPVQSNADLDGPLQHASLAVLGDMLVLVGGMHANDTLNAALYQLNVSDTSALQWRRARIQNGTEMPELYWHSAVPYTVNGSARVLLCGGVGYSDNGTLTQLSKNVYELAYNDTTGEYVVTMLDSLPEAMFGHSLAAGPDSTVYLTGGLRGRLEKPPRYAMPYMLAATMKGLVQGAQASADVYRFRRTSRGGHWTSLGSTQTAVALHASWVRGSKLFLYGGVQSSAVNASEATADTLQIYGLPAGNQTLGSPYNESAVALATSSWGGVRPGALSGAATWDDQQTQTFWLVGGWATPQPLPLSADRYICPQDSSLSWRWVAVEGEGSDDVGQWLPPYTGGMAPRTGVRGLVAPLTVGSSRKLLLVGGIAAGGWTGYTSPTSGTELYFQAEGSGLSFPDGAAPPQQAAAYQLHDVWLLDLETGTREAVWYQRAADCSSNSSSNSNSSNSSSSCAGGGRAGADPSSSLRGPFGAAWAPEHVGPLWDRRVLEAPGSAATVPGGGEAAVYMHVEERQAEGRGRVQSGVWYFTVTYTNISVDGRNISIPALSWQPLFKETASTDSAGCYLRVLHGATVLTSASYNNNTSYLVLNGGLAMSVVGVDNLKLTPTGATCLVELVQRSAGTVVAQRRATSLGAASGEPPARYRHACAARPGVGVYSMTCYGGVAADGAAVPADALTLTMVPGSAVSGASLGPITLVPVWSGALFAGWMTAPTDLAATRPGPRVDPVLLALRGVNDPSYTNATSDSRVPLTQYSPLLLLGGAPKADTPRDGVRSDLWLLDAAVCPDPDASASASISGSPQLQLSQTWLAVYPDGSLLDAADDAAEVAGDVPAAAWMVAAGAVSRGEDGNEVWLVLEDAGGTAGAQPRAVTVVRVKPTDDQGPGGAGCLSSAVRPVCSAPPHLRYRPEDAETCWRGSAAPLRVSGSLEGSTQSSDLFWTVGFVVRDADGVGAHYKNVTMGMDGRYSIEGLRLPPGFQTSNMTLVAYSKPYIQLTEVPLNATMSPLPFTSKHMSILVCVNNKTLLNVSLDLRVGYNGFYRKRGCDRRGPATCDTASPNATGWVNFEVVPIPDGSEVAASYAVVVRSVENYTAVLQDPGGNQPATVISQGGVRTTLRSTNQLVYQLDLPYSNPNMFIATVAFSVPPGTQLVMDAERKWYAGFYPKDSGATVPQVCLNDTYVAQKAYSVSLSAGRSYYMEIVDGRIPSLVLGTYDFSLPAVPAATVPVVMSAVILRVVFSRLAWPSEPYPRAARLMVQVSAVPSQLGDDGIQTFRHCRSPGASSSGGSAWRTDFLSDNGFTSFIVVPQVNYSVDLWYASSTGGLSLASTSVLAPLGSNGLGSTVLYNITLPQTLLCSDRSTTIINQPRGRFPTGNLSAIVYVVGTECKWIIYTGLPIMILRINTSGMAPGDLLQLSVDNLPSYALSSQDGVFSKRLSTANLTVAFYASHDTMGYGFTVEWDSESAATSMPPQFIMMIAASSAAAGAMLLFLCLWHCVFRPVQLRRQQAAAAAAAAANAAAAAGAATAGTRAAGHRNRVPRRYLRMMETSVFSAKDAALAKVAGGADSKPTALGGSSSPGGSPAEARPAAAAAVSSTAAAGGAEGTQAASSGSPASQSEPDEPAGEVCAICLADFEEGDRLKHLPCRHFYHVACIDQWLGRDITCPLCKDNVLEAMRTLFGPLPPRNPNRQQQQQQPQQQPQQPERPPQEAAAAAATSGGGAAVAGSPAGPPSTAEGADLEMVVIVPAEPGRSGRAASGGGQGPDLDAVDTSPASGRGLDGQSADRRAAAYESAAADPLSIDSPPRRTQGQGQGQGNGTDSRGSQRGVRRAATNDLTPDGTTTDSGTDSDSDAGASAALAAGAGTAAAANTRTDADGNSQAAGAQAPTAGSSTVAQASSPASRFGTATANGASGMASLSPRPVVEHVQHSSSSSSAAANGNAMRWIVGGAHVVPMSRLPAGSHSSVSLGSVPTGHHPRLPRAQEAQMAAAAAALSAAAAGVHGASSWRTGSLTSAGDIADTSLMAWSPRGATRSGAAAVSAVSAGGAGLGAAASPSSTSVPPPPVLGLGDGAVGAVVSYRVHNNPLAHNSSRFRTGSSTELGGPLASDDRPLGPGSPKRRQWSGGSGGGGGDWAASPGVSSGAAGGLAVHVQPPPGSGAGSSSVAVLTAGSPSRLGLGLSASSGGDPTRGAAPGGSNSTGGSRTPSTVGLLAVPSVSASCDDILRTPSSMARNVAARGPSGHGGGWSTTGTT